MNILFRIDQRSALLQGINAPHSTMRLEIDPSSLTESQRKLLANSLTDDLSSKIQIISPDYAGVMAALEELAETAAKQEATEREVAQTQRTNADNLVARCELALEAYKAGEPLKYIETYFSDPKGLVRSNPTIKAYHAAYEVDQADQAREKTKERLAQDEQRTQRKLAVEAEEAAHEAARWAVLRAAGEEELINRMGAGLAPESEVRQTVRKHLAAAINMPSGDVKWRALKSETSAETKAKLTAEEFARYQEIRKAIPDHVNTKVLAIKVWREALEDEEGDADGEVLAFAGKWLRCTWTDAATGLAFDRGYRLDS